MTQKLGHILLATALLVLAATAHAEGSQDFGGYVVHFNTFTTDMLTPEVAREYNISRSKSRALLNVSVLKKRMGTTGEAVAADVSASAVNLTGQLHRIPLREVKEGNAVYYIGEFGVSDQETLNFDVEVAPEGSEESFSVRFRQQYFTH